MDRLHSLFHELRGGILDLAWGQWTAAGLAGVHENTASVVDPEALLLASLTLGRYDARLLDEVLDWLSVNRERLDLARLRRLKTRMAASDRRLLTAVARLVSGRGGSASFERLLVEPDIQRGSVAEDDAATAVVMEAHPLFYSAAGQEADWEQPDPIFSAAGFLRAPVQLRGLSGQPNAGNPACLRFKVRALLGVGSRAEVLIYLLTHEWSHGRLIAERTAHAQAPVASYLTSLLDMGLVDKREEGKKVLYRLSDDVRGAFVVTSFVDWVRVWPGLAALLEALRLATATEQPTEEVAWMRLAAALAASEPALRVEGFDVGLGELRGWALRGPEVLADAVEKVAARVRQLAA